jgi:hypothetical protein
MSRLSSIRTYTFVSLQGKKKWSICITHLISNKRPIATPPAPYIPNAAANKSVKVLKKFWGDEIDVTDESNSEPDPIMASAPGRYKYLEDNLAKARAAKASKKKRRQKSPGSVQGGEASIIKTRSKSQILSINSQ